MFHATDRHDSCRHTAAPQLLAFRTQFIVAGPGLVPWAYDEQFVAGMADYLGPDSGVSNLTVRNWAQVNLANFPVGPQASPTLFSHTGP